MGVTTHPPRDERIALEMRAGPHREEDGWLHPSLAPFPSTPRIFRISQSTIYVFLLFSSLLELIHAAQLEIRNQCPYTVWAAAVWAAAVPAGGKQLKSSQSWTITVPEGTTQTRIWGRTGCTFDANGRGQCQTGDCGGVLECTDYGFKLPMDFSPTTTVGCRGGARCSGDINSQCPNELRAPGGCNNPCTVFKTDQYCCNSGNCGPTNFSRFFKDRCPDAYSYPMDNQTHTVICPFGTNYRVVFCP